jgi:hypothetical protein
LYDNWTAGDVFEDFVNHITAVKTTYENIVGKAATNPSEQACLSDLVTRHATNCDLACVRADIAHSFEAETQLETIYQVVLGRSIDPSGYTTYSNALATGWTLAQVRNDVAHSTEALSLLDEHYQAVWSQPIDQEFLDHYTFLLTTGNWTLAEVHDDMEEIYFQTVLVPVLIVTTLLQ